MQILMKSWSSLVAFNFSNVIWRSIGSSLLLPDMVKC